MGPKCTICNSPYREQIDQLIVSGASNRSIVAQYDSISIGAVQRHRTNHIGASLVAAKEVQDVARSDYLLHLTRNLLEQAQSITDEARSAGDLRTAVAGIGQIKNIVALLMSVQLESPIRFVELGIQGVRTDD